MGRLLLQTRHSRNGGHHTCLNPLQSFTTLDRTVTPVHTNRCRRLSRRYKQRTSIAASHLVVPGRVKLAKQLLFLLLARSARRCFNFNVTGYERPAPQHSHVGAFRKAARNQRQQPNQHHTLWVELEEQKSYLDMDFPSIGACRDADDQLAGAALEQEASRCSNFRRWVGLVCACCIALYGQQQQRVLCSVLCRRARVCSKVSPWVSACSCIMVAVGLAVW